MDPQTYSRLLRFARRHSRRFDEADDLLQTALLLAIERQRGDMSRSDNRRWLCGVLRNRAAFEARSAARRRKRELDFAAARGTLEAAPVTVEPGQVVAILPPALRTTALLVLTGHTKTEVRWLLNLSDAAFRKRVSLIRRHWRNANVDMSSYKCGPKGDLQFGALRRALISRTKDEDVEFAAHDPDGHLFVVRSQNPMPRQRKVV